MRPGLKRREGEKCCFGINLSDLEINVTGFQNFIELFYDMKTLAMGML